MFKYDHHSMLNSQHGFLFVPGGGGDMGRDVYDHLVSTKIFALIRNKKLIRAPQNHEEIGYYLALDLLTILY